MENEEENLYKELKENFELGFKKLSKKYTPKLFFYCKKAFGIRTEDAEEIVQDVLFIVYGKFSTFIFSEENSISKWLYTITKNKVIDFKRNEKKFRDENLVYSYNESGNSNEDYNLNIEAFKSFFESVNSEDIFKSDIHKEMILEIVNEFNEEETADIFNYFYCIPYSEIAIQTSKSIDSVKKRISRTIQKLLKKIIEKFNLKDEKLYERIKKDHQKDLRGRFAGK